MVQDVGIAYQQKVQKQGRDDRIKRFSIQPHPILNVERYVGGVVY